MQVCDSEDTLDDEMTSVECMLPRALPIFSPVRADASVPFKWPGDISTATKGETQSYWTERGS